MRPRSQARCPIPATHRGPSRPAAFTREETYRGDAPARRSGVDVDPGRVHVAPSSTRSSWSGSSRARGCPSASRTRSPSRASFVVVDVAGRSLIVCRNRSGELRAHHNVCRHRGDAALRRGARTVERFFQCPYHAWAYDLDGACLGTPLFTPESRDPAGPAGRLRHVGRELVRQGRLRPLPGAGRVLGLPRLRLPRPGGARARATSSATCPSGSPATGSASSGCSAASSTRSRRTGSSSARTSWSTTTCPGCIPAS